MTLHTAGKDVSAIQQALEKDQLLVACLCAGWCSSCDNWQSSFKELAATQPEHCFVWLDVDDNPDMVAEVDLETMPVLLLQQNETIYFLGTIEPKPSIVNGLLQHRNVPVKTNDPGIYQFLLEG